MSGRFSIVTAATSIDVCQDCPDGWYQSESGQRACVPCAEGTFYNGTASSANSCQRCKKGKFAAVASGASTCLDCLAGRYSENIGASSIDTCQVCPDKTVSSKTGASSAKACQACSGTLVSNNMQTKCVPPTVDYPLILGIAVSALVLLVGVGFYCFRLRRRAREDHFYELTEQNQHTQRLLDSANNPLEQTQYLIDPSELHLGE
jgi:hypothetical protein